MKQTRFSIGCQDWQSMTEKIGATAAAVYLYLRTMMRGMQAAEITITLSELAQAVKLPSDATESALRAICAEYMERENNANGTITLRDRKEAAAQADIFRKRASRALARSQKIIEAVSSPDSPKKSPGQSGVSTEKGENLSAKQYQTDFFMIYHGLSDQKEKTPHTPKKEKSLTEIQTHTRKASPARQQSTAPRVDEIDLPSDQLEAEYIDIVGNWPNSLRKAVQAEKDDVREAFYLCIRKRQTDEGRAWSADQIRMTWLAARRIPEERRAESILAWGMGNWKTIRDCGSGCYFEKETGRVVSLVRGTVERGLCSATQRENADLAVELARKMRRD